MSDDLLPVVSEGGGELTLARPPTQVLAEAREAATALKTVIDGKAKPVKFNGETYLELEDWLTCGRFYGMTARVAWTRPISFGDIDGWEARADAITTDGRVVASAEAMCLRDEDKWRARPKYEWHYVTTDGEVVRDDPGKDKIVWEGRKPKRTRVMVGEEPVPLFQLRSMAQTRACAKALRSALAWVVVLAGYKPTVAEEMTGDEAEVQTEQAQQPRRSSEREQRDGEKAERTISEPQRKRMYAIYKGGGHEDDAVKAWLATAYGIEHGKDVPRRLYDEICKHLKHAGALEHTGEGGQLPLEPEPEPIEDAADDDIKFGE